MRPPVPHGTSLKTLLYVGDNPANLELVEQLLAQLTYLCLISATDGDSGIEFARSFLREIILLDINLPGISGIQMLSILRADPATAHIPVVALSANALPHEIEKCLAAGFYLYLTKPIEVNQFMGVLDAALAMRKQKRPAFRSGISVFGRAAWNDDCRAGSGSQRLQRPPVRGA